ncbi:plasmid stabilization protein [Polaribacter gangjinensis]|uniref:Plasmid stabilization protein n=1 Tax=Polaribacter gangjinensis TaxID=574710 RepID=A0A2S7WAQ3_9FLAO|nr:plasmid stabilization protein [Polaribacter gangjinensis]
MKPLNLNPKLIHGVKNIYDYYLEKAGHQIAKKIVDGIYNETLKLKKHPEIGQNEELLKGLNQEFKYLIHENYKVIYWINIQKKCVEIIDVFDTRQNPVKIKRTK